MRTADQPSGPGEPRKERLDEAKEAEGLDELDVDAGTASPETVRSADGDRAPGGGNQHGNQHGDSNGGGSGQGSDASRTDASRTSDRDDTGRGTQDAGANAASPGTADPADDPDRSSPAAHPTVSADPSPELRPTEAPGHYGPGYGEPVRHEGTDDGTPASTAPPVSP